LAKVAKVIEKQIIIFHHIIMKYSKNKKYLIDYKNVSVILSKKNAFHIKTLFFL